MMWKWIFFFGMLPLSLFGQTESGGRPLSLYEAHRQLVSRSRSLQIANLQVAQAREERRVVRSTWFPSLLASGTALRFSNDLRVGLPDTPWLTSLLDKLDLSSFTFPLLDRQVTSTGLTLFWPAFTGGKRLYAGRIGRLMEQSARVVASQTESTLLVTLVQTYYALRLSTRVVEVRREAWEAMVRHEREAVLMVSNGLITKTEALYVKVGLEEAHREWLAAVQEQALCRRALMTLLYAETLTDEASGEEDDRTVTTPLFIIEELPSNLWFRTAMAQGNYGLSLLDLQGRVADNRWRLAKSDYWPEIVLFGQQTLYAHHLPKNLVPRTVVGIGLTWTLFEGGRREAIVRETALERDRLSLEQKKASEELDLAVDRLYHALLQSQEAMAPLRTSLRLCRELVRMCRQRFREGMATATEVVDAETRLSTVEVTLLTNLYQFDVTLAQLLSLCGQSDTFWQWADRGIEEQTFFETSYN